MKFSQIKAPAKAPRLVKTPKGISNIKQFDTVIKTWNKIPPQLLKSLIVSMPKQVYEERCKKSGLHINQILCIIYVTSCRQLVNLPFKPFFSFIIG